MIGRTWFTQAAVGVFLCFCFVFAMFSVAGDEIATDSSVVSAMVVGDEVVDSATVIPASSVSVETESVPALEVVDAGSCSEEHVCVPIDEVVADEEIADSIVSETDDTVLIALPEEETSTESSEDFSVSETDEAQTDTAIPLMRVDKGKKVMETVVDSSDEEEIFFKTDTEETVALYDGRTIVKEITVSSDEHFDNEIIYYTDLLEEVTENQITIHWKSEGKNVDFETYDTNGNGLIDRVSFTIPHLSTQVFEIIIHFDAVETVNATDISIVTVSAPSGTVSNQQVGFDFDVAYYNSSLVSCAFDVTNANGSVIDETLSGSQTRLNRSLMNGAYTWNMHCFDTTNVSIEHWTNGSFSINYNYAPIVDLSASSSSITRGSLVTFSVNVSAPVDGAISYSLNYLDGSSATGSASSARNLFESKSHTFNTTGSFVVNLTATVDYGGFSQTASDYVTISVSEPTSTADTQAPVIRLVEPDDNEAFVLASRDTIIDFSYNVTDNVRIANCTFEIYYFNSSSVGERVVNETKRDIDSNSSTISYEFHDFDEGDYTWDVECYDNVSNHGSVSDRDFSVVYETSEEEESDTVNSEVQRTVPLSTEDEANIGDVESVITAINDFLIDEEKYGVEERKAIEDLGIDENLKFYKKKLLQMKLDLEHNLDYVQGADKRAQRKAEIVAELQDMKKHIPTSLTVTESHEYFKNSLEVDLEDVVAAYVTAKGIVLDARGVRDMAAQNEPLQNQLTVSARVASVEVSYFDGTDDEFVLVAKDLTFKSKSFDSIIEVIPKEVVQDADDVTFLVDSTVLKQDPIFEIQLDALTKETLVYTIRKAVDLQTFEKTSTLVFKEDIPRDNIRGISGFVSFVGNIDMGIGFYLSWIIAIVLLCVIGTFSYRKIQLNRLKKHAETRTLLVLAGDIERLLKARDIEKARQKYVEAKGLYASVPEKGRNYVYKKLQKLHVEIDKKDISALVREFMAASREGRKQDALTMYGNIQKLYPRMPAGYKEKVFEKIEPYLKDLRK